MYDIKHNVIIIIHQKGNHNKKKWAFTLFGVVYY